MAPESMHQPVRRLKESHPRVIVQDDIVAQFLVSEALVPQALELVDLLS